MTSRTCSPTSSPPLSANPTDVARPTQQWHDTDPVLRPPYGTKPFFYRVRVQDVFLIRSAPSATIGAAVPDTVPPGPTDVVGADGHAKHIRVEFKPNPEPDVAGYQIYRGVCDYGYVYVPGIVRKREGEPEHRDDRYRCDMTLVGDVPIGDANAILAVDGIIWFDDHSVPAGSPVCYAYWVRAYDFAGNLYGGDEHACPASRNEYRCASLREKTPPQVPVVTGLRARNNGVLVEWIASPEQDLRAFHVYRSDLEFDPPKFLACVFTDGTVASVALDRQRAVVQRRARGVRSAHRTRILRRRHGGAAPRVLVPGRRTRLARQRERWDQPGRHPGEQHLHVHERPAAHPGDAAADAAHDGDVRPRHRVGSAIRRDRDQGLCRVPRRLRTSRTGRCPASSPPPASPTSRRAAGSTTSTWCRRSTTLARSPSRHRPVLHRY